MSPEMLSQVASELETYIRKQFLVRAEDREFNRGVNLWEGGYIDSTGLVSLILALEEKYEIKIPESVLFDPDFTSIDGMARLLARLLAP